MEFTIRLHSALLSDAALAALPEDEPGNEVLPVPLAEEIPLHGSVAEARAGQPCSLQAAMEVLKERVARHRGWV